MSTSPNRTFRAERNPSPFVDGEGRIPAVREKAGLLFGWLLGAGLVVAFAVRWWLLWRAYLIPDADQTIVSL
ncbi:MAG TPA: hypothetical protein VN837_04900, partial [Chloroflexota bacterium]|nr:hypothetical protein [Chloroflexota bacterium]